MTTFTRTWNAAYEQTPADTDQASEGAERIRDLKNDISERVEVDHSYAGDVDDGMHKKVTFVDPLGAKPTQANDETYLYTKDVSGTSELFFEDEAGNEVQLTAGGVLKPSTVMALTNAENTFTKRQNWAKGGDIASANPLPIDTDGNYFDVTGAVGIAAMTAPVGCVFKLHFDGALVLTHSDPDLILPGGANITTAAGDEAEFVCYATGDVRCTNYTPASGEAVVSPDQKLVAMSYTEYLTYSSSAVNIPADDTIPTSSEGFEVFTHAHTPNAANNELFIDVLLHAAPSGGGGITGVAALFKDSDTAAMAVGTEFLDGSVVYQIRTRIKYVAPSTSAITFKVRAGVNSGTIYINGRSTGRQFGGKLISGIRVLEYLP